MISENFKICESCFRNIEVLQTVLVFRKQSIWGTVPKSCTSDNKDKLRREDIVYVGPEGASCESFGGSGPESSMATWIEVSAMHNQECVTVKRIISA